MARSINALFSSGFYKVGRLAGALVRVHWTTPIGLFILTGFSFNPLVWGALLLVIVIHELGHAFLARRYALGLVSIDITGVGGVCRIEGNPSQRETSIVAWGGVLAQAALLVAALLVRAVFHVVAFGVLDGVFDTLITTNVIVLALNLLPVRPLDGYEAWRLFTR